VKKRIIAIFTGNRAEYGLQFPIIRAIANHPKLEYKLLVSGAHLDANFGNTLDEIRKDGFRIEAEVKIEMGKDSNISTSLAIGNGILSISKVLKRIKPDLMVVYADRFEGFSAVIAATQMNIPTAHIEGGDLTEGGALDDSVRHAMTKLSHLHFTTNQQASNRLLAMGEENWRVHTVGFPAIDLISEDCYATKHEVEDRLSLNLDQPVVLFTQHSVTTEFEQAGEQIKPSIKAIKKLAENGVQVILTYPNNDAGGQTIIALIEQLGLEKQNNIQLHQSLGRYLYHGVLALALYDDIKMVCVGNSSSGIKETPVFGCPTVNIGSRQRGRLRADNVIDTEYSEDAIYDAVKKCLSDKDFIYQCKNTNNPYYLGGAGIKVAEKLAEVELGKSMLRKKMTIKGEVNCGWFQ
jgi:UDP-hydrolysing UDP-N-acetyl-D-glucosamine 2-epimerase